MANVGDIVYVNVPEQRRAVVIRHFNGPQYLMAKCAWKESDSDQPSDVHFIDKTDAHLTVAEAFSFTPGERVKLLTDLGIRYGTYQSNDGNEAVVILEADSKELADNIDLAVDASRATPALWVLVLQNRL